ncbi:hypothetical protein GSY74_07770 [Sulfurovum sp. bin170]|uniref:hypothetical protein n=1 Tax=Sulfurovum sp. bin170 TaxID=2695268 RepID=UPI0013E0BD40|nr:hypothetical protein [Sulfurovum sp. bin170]NEW61177.1 hypothetical protein [Sulfurovum sp. bin170]
MKWLVDFLQNSLESETLVPNRTRLKPSVPSFARFLVFLTILSSALLSSNLSTLYKFYEKQEYDRGCDYAMKHFNKNRKNEKYLTLYGLTCLETDNIHRIATPMIILKETKESRENASYFATILLQKQLLKQALLDEKALGDLNLPKTNFLLSKIFSMFVNKKYALKDGVYKLEDGDKKYQLYIENKYLIIDIYQNDKFTKRYRYK